MEGERNPVLDNSIANRLVILSKSLLEYFVLSIFKPPLDPPKGTSTIAHLYVINEARASILLGST